MNDNSFEIEYDFYKKKKYFIEEQDNNINSSQKRIFIVKMSATHHV